MIKAWENVQERGLKDVAKDLKKLIETPAVIILDGPVGAGKTTFIRQFVSLSSPEAFVSSPTYSIINENDDLVHADFYRLNGVDDILHLEIPLYLEDKNFFLIEWGISYVDEIKRYVPDEFKFYLLEIELSGLNRTFVLSN